MFEKSFNSHSFKRKKRTQFIVFESVGNFIDCLFKLLVLVRFIDSSWRAENILHFPN